jgi:hypothetical protein
MVKRHKGKLKRAPPASHLATSPLAEVGLKEREVFGETSARVPPRGRPRIRSVT